MLFNSLIACLCVSIGFVLASQDSFLLSNASLLWGAYRPNVYVGLKPAVPDSILMGLMWSTDDDPQSFIQGLRHTCEQDDGMAGYGWQHYDPRSGGVHVVNDTKHNFDVVTHFAKDPADENGGTWRLKIQMLPRKEARPSQKGAVVFYVGTEAQHSFMTCKSEAESTQKTRNAVDIVCEGRDNILGAYRFETPAVNIETDSFRSLDVLSDLWKAKSIFEGEFRSNHVPPVGVAEKTSRRGNLHFLHRKFEGEFEFDVVWTSSSALHSLDAKQFPRIMTESLQSFNSRFDKVFAPEVPFADVDHTRFSKALLANLLGGVGHFHGKNKVAASSSSTSGSSSPAGTEQGPYELLSAVPSRSKFPRGFLWDEGFHLQTILEWDLDLALKMLSSWFDRMDEEGWIAREQILGAEANSKVPPDFQTQYKDHANPPTLFLVVEAFVDKLIDPKSYNGNPSKFLQDLEEEGKPLLRELYQKMKTHYEWFRKTQAGRMELYQTTGPAFTEGYRWRGGTGQHILPSGLDDYPRAQPPSDQDLHVDALSWVGLMAQVLTKTSQFLIKEGGDELHKDAATFTTHHKDILRTLYRIHWSESEQAYCDVTSANDMPKHICHKGYVSLMPFITGLVEPNHPHLSHVLYRLRDPHELWSSPGIRSLSLKDELHGTGEDYWRGSIWVNINYMILKRLLELAQYEPESGHPNPYKSLAAEMHNDLRINLVSAVYRSWVNTGFAWEHYHPESGRGRGAQGFTGWTALVVNIMAMPALRKANAAVGGGGGGGGGGVSVEENGENTGGRYVWQRIGTSDERAWNNYVILSFGILLVFLFWRRRLFRRWRRL